ncbi:MAG TPA: Vps62-related protein [Archangium sp.]|nr:Vps62-related protein [Archangium sp.]
MSESIVTLYVDSEYRGTSKALGVGRYSSGIGLKNDSLSSLKIPNGLKVTLFEHSDFKGRRSVLVRDTPDLGGVNDEASSMIIERVTSPSVIVYTDSNFRGWSTELPVGSQASSAIGNDKVSSVIVPQGYRVTLYKNASFKGETKELTADAASLGDFNDRTSSIVVDRLSDRTPTFEELNQIIKKVGPRVYFHPDDPFGPSSVEWFLERATLYTRGGSSRSANSAPLPAGGSDDGAYWLQGSRDARGGDLSSAVAYVNAKYQNQWLDIQFWIFYPYNGAGRATVTVAGFGDTLKLDPMGQHGGDWEHVTCRVDPVSQELRAMYLSQHSGGQWVALGDIQLENGRPVVYSSRNGHAAYRGEGSNLSNGTSQSWAGVKWFEFGLLNSTAKGSKLLDCGSKYQFLRANFLTDAISVPNWTQYCRRWGPHITYPQSVLMEAILSGLGSIPDVAKVADAIWDAIPGEFKEENGPTGPWMKRSWSGDE